MSLRSQVILPWCAAFVLAGAAGAGAQDEPAGAQRPTTSGQTDASDAAGAHKVGDTITVTGCLATEADALGRRGLAVGDDELVLTELETGTAGAVATSGETGGRGGLETARRLAKGTYVLTGEREDDLEALAGKRVEITGRLTQQASTYRTMPDTPDPPGSESGGASADDTAATEEAEAGATNTGSTRGMEPGMAGARGPDERAGIEAARRAEALPHLEVTSFREVEGDCPSAR